MIRRVEQGHCLLIYIYMVLLALASDKHSIEIPAEGV